MYFVEGGVERARKPDIAGSVLRHKDRAHNNNSEIPKKEIGEDINT